MPKVLIINSSHYVPGSSNTFQYNLPQSTKFLEGSSVGVVSISLFNSTFNITAARGNNTLTFIFNAATPATYNWTIPDGYYTISDLNYWLQSQFIVNKLYATTTTGNVYFYDFVQNSVRYSVQTDSYYIPTSAQATTLGYAIATGATWAWPASAQTPQMTWNASFGALIGQPAQTFPSSIQSSNQSMLSAITPIISPVNSYILTCNLINSRYSLPSNTFFSVPVTGAVGSLITFNSASVVFCDIAPNIYNSIIIQLYDQNWNQLQLIDKEVVITLAINEPFPEK